jgi:hypothetical protein
MASGVPPDPAQGAELVHVATRTQVTRLSVGETQVVRKQPLGPDAQQRLEHERAMLKRLRGVRGVAQLLDAPQYPGSIVMADAGGTNLADSLPARSGSGTVGAARSALLTAAPGAAASGSISRVAARRA